MSLLLVMLLCRAREQTASQTHNFACSRLIVPALSGTLYQKAISMNRVSASKRNAFMLHYECQRTAHNFPMLMLSGHDLKDLTIQSITEVQNTFIGASSDFHFFPAPWKRLAFSAVQLSSHQSHGSSWSS